MKFNLILFYGVFVTMLFTSLYLMNRNGTHTIPLNKDKKQCFKTQNHKLLVGDSYLNHQMKSTLCTSNCILYSFPGANSKQILKHLNTLLDTLNTNIDTCILITGVNDAMGHYGKKFYTHHLTQAIELLHHNNIAPVITNIPPFPINQAINKLPAIPKFLTYVYAQFDNNGKLDNINNYNSAIKETLLRYPKVIYYEFEEEFSNANYYWDYIHLTPEANRIFIEQLKAELRN